MNPSPTIQINFGKPAFNRYYGIKLSQNKILPRRQTVLTSNVIYNPYTEQPTASSQVNVVGGPPTVREIPMSFPPAIIPPSFSVNATKGEGLIIQEQIHKGVPDDLEII